LEGLIKSEAMKMTYASGQAVEKSFAKSTGNGIETSKVEIGLKEKRQTVCVLLLSLSLSLFLLPLILPA